MNKELNQIMELEEQIEDLKNALYEARETLKNTIIIPEGATNRDMIKAMFPTLEMKNECNGIFYMYDTEKDRGIPMIGVDYNWWNAPYKGVE